MMMLPGAAGHLQSNATEATGAALVHAHDVVPGLHRQLLRRQRHLDDAGAIDQDINGTDLLLDLPRTAFHRVLVGHIRDPRPTANLLRDCMDAPSWIHQTIFSAACREFAAAGAAPMPPRAPDHCDTALELKLTFLPSSLIVRPRLPAAGDSLRAISWRPRTGNTQRKKRAKASPHVGRGFFAGLFISALWENRGANSTDALP